MSRSHWDQTGRVGEGENGQANMANQMEDPFAELRRKMEEILGYPPGSLDPASNFIRDVERINRWLGRGFVRLSDVMSPQQIADKIMAGFEEPAGREVFDLPRKMWELRPPSLDGFLKRY